MTEEPDNPFPKSHIYTQGKLVVAYVDMPVGRAPGDSQPA